MTRRRLLLLAARRAGAARHGRLAALVSASQDNSAAVHSRRLDAPFLPYHLLLVNRHGSERPITALSVPHCRAATVSHDEPYTPLFGPQA
jgi:hypothetical protein